MANQEHVEVLKRGVRAWNLWWQDKWEEFICPDFSGADLKGFSLTGAALSFADFSEANLAFARLASGTLPAANFQAANLTGATLAFAQLTGATFKGANLTRAVFNYTALGNVDFTGAKGLESCRHLGPSTIDHRTIMKSGRLPLNFLRGCGLPDTLIDYLPSLLNEPIQFFASFISYSSKDQKFADRLYADLQNTGVRCWLATEDLKIGDKIRTGIDEAIRLHDKLLLVLSKYSVVSDWVGQEVETALERERKEKRTVLFPIRLDDAVMKVENGWPALIRNTRNIGDFRKWKNHDSYQTAFDRLLRNLKAEDGQATKPKEEKGSKKRGEEK
jgi:uncharacterized protein YjbI with pentapeptide repeats